MKNKKRLIIGLFLSCFSIAIVFPEYIYANDDEFNYHFVGWFNTFIPGGGAFLQDKYFLGVSQLILESSSFAAGYSLSPRRPMTLDGVPEELPQPYLFESISQFNKTNYHKDVWASSSKVERAMLANTLQEFGIKYHMVNVFNAYRDSAKANNSHNKWIDYTSTSDLFLAPFNPYVLSDPWVCIPLGVTAIALVVNYLVVRDHYIEPVSKVNSSANSMYAATYGGVYPLGSGAPEEMFYRGFLQNEAYSLIPTPFFSIPVSTFAFAYSHSEDERIPAGIAGSYMGYLTHRKHGRLSPAIAYHFWSDVFTGILSIVLYVKWQHNASIKSDSLPQTKPILFSFTFYI